MNILYHFRTQGTGAEGVHIAGVARAFEELGHRVVFSSPTGIDPRKSAGTNPFGTRKRGLLARLAAHAPGFVFECMEIGYNFVAWLRNRTLVSREKCDLIYERHAFFLCTTAQIASQREIPLVVEVNELAGDDRVRSRPVMAGFARWADHYTFSRARLIVVVSPHLKRRITELGIESERVLVLPNAVSEELLDSPVDGAAIRERHGLAGSVVIGFIGWFVEWHRLDRLLAGFAAIAGDHPNARLLLVGDGTLKDSLVQQAAQLGIANRVHFTGSIPHSDIPAHVAAMDISVVPHSNEFRSPIKLFEAMARGCAVLAPDTEPIAMVLRDGENGVLFDPEEAGSLRSGMLRLLGDDALRKRLGEQAQADVRARHTWKRNAEAVLAALAAQREDQAGGERH